MLAAFIIWMLVGVLFIAMGIYDCFAKSTRPFGFWSNVKPAEVTDVAAYNKALGKLFIVFGLLFGLLGLPLLAGQNSPWIIFSIIGCLFLAIGAMVVFTVVIEPKYCKK